MKNANNLNEVLDECKSYAKSGYEIASTQAKALEGTLDIAERRIEDTLDDFNRSPCYATETTDILTDQLRDIERSFNQLSYSFYDQLLDLKDREGDFSITLFGRTVAGKSTLMEVLTHGDGSSIGKGGQRTTKDTRTYSWNGLRITDVPGVNAFHGEDDEQKAIKEAMMADLIIYLIADDAPQESDAYFFSKIVELGKPIICVLNVKVGIKPEKSAEEIEKRISRVFDETRLSEIKNEFLDYAKIYGQSWNHIPFVYVHLLAAFLAQHENDLAKKKVLHYQSRIAFLEKKIIQVVESNGRYYRIKSFIDIVSNPVLDCSVQLLDHSAASSAQGRIILAKRRELSEWKERFIESSHNQIKSLIANNKSKLYQEIARFSEKYYASKNSDTEWIKVVDGYHLEEQCKDLLIQFDARCNDQLREVARQIEKDIKYSTGFTNGKIAKMHKIFNGKRAWDWSALVLGGGFTIGSGIAYLLGATIATPLGIGAIAIAVIGGAGDMLFKSRGKKEQEARLILENSLKKNVDKTCNYLEAQLERNLEIMISKKIDQFVVELDKINRVVFRLADTQRDLSWELNKRLLELNKQSVFEALKLLGMEDYSKDILECARIPGSYCLILIDNGVNFPAEFKIELKKLTSERIGFVVNHNEKKIVVSRILGKEIDRKWLSVEEKIGVIHINNKIEMTPDLEQRKIMAQQLSGMQIEC